ncbi:MAG: UDP-GlcNAc:undecaprenyl-phosphate GlcNAc-1-phosphate transferase [Pseudohongiellaceae bacterium]|jgi:UDP-GlcNAc:undecaprenyl-phosphate GlcNAc-1-phosphate transferase
MPSDTFTNVIWYGLTLATAVALALYITPLTIRVALNFQIHDTPDGRLKKHTQPTPYLGGLAIASSFVIAFAVLSTPGTTNYQAMGILTGGFMVMLLGLYDDLTNLPPSVKFLGQLLAAVVIYKAGVRVDISSLPSWANLALTLLWVTGVANAINIIDIMDGLAAGTALIATAFLFAISVASSGTQVVPFMAIALAGALFGYLRFNFEPAKIFMGDTGSLFVGFLLGSLSMVVSYSQENTLAIVAPLVLLSVPIFDTVFVAFHRARKGIPFFRGSPDHFALRLRHAGWSVRRVVLSTYAVAVTLGILTLLVVFGPPSWVPVALGLTLLGWIAAFIGLSRMPPPSPRPRASDDTVEAEPTI